MNIRTLLASSLLVVLPATGMMTLPTSALAAGDYRDMSCDELWYERNSIFAEKGYCFETDRARNAFPDACFPPYGRLSPREQSEVQRIKEWEYRKDCN